MDDSFGWVDSELSCLNSTCGWLRQRGRATQGKDVVASWGHQGSGSYPFVTLGLGEGSGQAQLGNKSQGLTDG